MRGLYEKSLGFGGVMCVFVVVLVGVFVVVFGAMPVLAHSGVVDRNGCHTRTDTGERHCHGRVVGTQSPQSNGVARSDVRYDQTPAALFCGPWLQDLMSTPEGVQYLVGSIGQAVLQRDYDWIPSIGVDGLPQFTFALKKAGLKIVSIQTKVIDGTNQLSWVLVVKNDSINDKTFTATLQWSDRAGFVLHSRTKHGFLVRANEEKRFAGYTYLADNVARPITSINAKLTYTDVNNTVQHTAPITK